MKIATVRPMNSASARLAASLVLGGRVAPASESETGCSDSRGPLFSFVVGDRTLSSPWRIGSRVILVDHGELRQFKTRDLIS